MSPHCNGEIPGKKCDRALDDLARIKITIVANMCDSLVYSNVNSALNILKNEYGGRESVRELLSIYYKECDRNVTENCPVEKRQPFIVLEGLDAAGKSTISRNLAGSIDADLHVSPPNTMRYLRDLFDGDLKLRCASYTIGNYITSAQVGRVLIKKAVILDRYWHSTSAYALAQAVEHKIINSLPPIDDEIYEWPSDLTRPDLVVLLRVSEEERQRRHALRNTTNTSQEQKLKNNPTFRNNVIKAYGNMKTPGIEIVDADAPLGEVLQGVGQKIQALFE